MTFTPANRTKVFISYSHKDDKFLQGLLPHLKYLEKNNLIDFWADTKIKPSEKWKTEIEEALASASVAILLISIDFLISQFVVDNELPPLLAAAEARGVKILPVVLRPCTLPKSLSQFQAINSPTKPLSKMKGYEREELWVKVANVIVEIMGSHVSNSIPEQNPQKISNTKLGDIRIPTFEEALKETVEFENKRKNQKFDVFLCYDGSDRQQVKEVGEQLLARGILPWFDEWELRPGFRWQEQLERQIDQIKSVAVFIGKTGRVPLQDMETYAFLKEFEKRECPIIPVLLPDAQDNPNWPGFLSSRKGVDFRIRASEPIEMIIWGITGKEGVFDEKNAAKDFDVFLSYNKVNRPEVKIIAEQLKAQRILPWFDEWVVRPGDNWVRALEEQIDHIKSVAVFVGKDGIAPWQRQEDYAILQEFVNRGRPVIPVLLKNSATKPKLPLFLKGMTWVDFRNPDHNALSRLIWGITGNRNVQS